MKEQRKCYYAVVSISLSLLLAAQPVAAAVPMLQSPVVVSEPGNAFAEDPSVLLSDAKDRAVAWLQKQLAEEPETDLPGDTLDILQLLHNEGKEQDIRSVCGWERLQQGKNTDQDARYAAAFCDAEGMEEIMERQNPDGGFGLTEGYQSDPLDSMLVLQGLQQCGMWQETEALLSYLASICCQDGGYSYTAEGSSDPWLTARIGREIILSTQAAETAHFQAEQDQILQGIDTYVISGKWDTLSEQDFLESAWVSAYAYERGLQEYAVISSEALLQLQQQDGSFYGNIQDTAAAVYLLKAMYSYWEFLALDRMQTDCSTHILETEKSNTVQVTVRMGISVVKKRVVKLVVQAEKQGQILDRQTVSLLADSSKKEYQETVSVTFDQPEYRDGSREYTIHTMLYAGEDCLGETTDSMTVRKKADREIRLQAEVTTGQAYGIRLDWNDISDEESVYGYRVCRQRGEQAWESRSTWDGQEKVRVLNIYPCDDARDYLADWMEETVNDGEDPAGMGLFEIDTVHIREYNSDPGRYLTDTRGDYRYDVLMFGTYDSNDYQDISDEAYKATQAFLDTGRGVLFGHDTIVSWMKNFSRFADQIGIRLKPSYTRRDTTKVNVVQWGLLTSFPWKLSSTLQIPATHTQAQYTGGTLSADVWMELDSEYDTDQETGGMTNAYLFTKNQMAMIQTGHSNGQATDDERKVIANTLFYLKQLTNKTNVQDTSFYDEAAPVIESAQAEGDSIRITAADKGTDYRYYVEGVPQGAGNETETKQSNRVEATALSGIQGYIMSIDHDPEEDDSLAERKDDGSLKAEILPLQQAENTAVEPEQQGILALPSEERKPGTWYIHLRAVDYAGNLSEETTIPFWQEEDKHPWFQTGYGLFSMKNDINLNCNEAKIGGDIYSGKDFNFGGSILSVSGICQTVGNANIYGWKLDVPQKISTEPLSTPDYRKEILQDLQQSGTVQELTCYNNTEIREPVICSRTTGAWCPDLKVNAALVCQGDISLNTNTLSAGETEPVVVMSQAGDITVNCTDVRFNGLLYAPEGTVSLNVSQCSLAGTIIAKEIRLSGTYFDIHQPDVP